MSNAPTDDALVRELNAALAGPDGKGPAVKELVAPDPAPAQAPALADQLETSRPPAPPANIPQRVANADKTHSKAAGGFGFRVTVKGQYYAKSTETKGNLIKDYELPFNLPSLTNSKGESALGIIIGASRPGGGMLKAALQKMDPLAITFRTHEIVNVIPLNGAPEPTSIAYMSFEALKKYARAQFPDFPVDVDEYLDVNHLREDLVDFITNKTTDVIFEPGTLSESKIKGGFGVKKSPSDRIRERHAARKEEAELAAMNPGVL